MTDTLNRIEAEQIKVIYSQSGTAIVGNLLSSTLLGLIQWGVVDTFTIVAWVACVYIVTIARLSLYLLYRRVAPPERSIGIWGRWYLALLLLSGCVWGVSSLILFPSQSPLNSVLMVMWFIGIGSAGGISAYLVYMPALLVHFIPVVLPGAVRLFVIGDRFHSAIGAAVIMYCFVLLSASRRINRSMVKAIKTNLELQIEIAERAKAEQAMAESHRRLELITDNIPACIAQVDATELKYQFVNRRHLERMGRSRSEVIGKHVAEILGPAKFEFAKPYIDKALSGSPASYVNRFMLQGEPSWVNVNYVPNVDESGSVRGIVVLTHDITETKKIEEALRQSENDLKKLYMEANQARELYRSLLESTPDSIVIYDMQGRVTFVNEAFVRTFGWRLDELAGGVPYTPESEREVTSARVRDVVEYGIPVSHFETKRLTKDGSLVDVSISASRFYDHVGNSSGMLVILRDMSSNVRMQKQLEEAKNAAEAASKAKSTFLANMSHELRTPLNVILGFSQLMSRAPRLPAEQRANLETISRSGEHLLSLINDVLEFSKIEAGRLELHLENFDLNHLIRELDEMFRLRAREKGLYLDMELEAHVPRHIRADQRKLRQVLINLLGNAVKFTDVGGVTLRVTREAEQDGHDGVRFDVADTGRGIGEDEQSKVFESFFQAGEKQSGRQGTGLGLPISERFVQMMGGRLTLESEVGRGTRFSFCIPVKGLTPSDAVSSRETSRVVGLEEGQPEFRLLVVEDNDHSRVLLVRLLQSVGFSVEEARDGQEAVAVWERMQPHLIWMDMRMPVMDGYEATKRIKSSPGGADTIVIALTASAFEEDRMKVMAHGCDDFVRKPFREHEIFEVLSKHLGVKFISETRSEGGRGKAAASVQELRRALNDLSEDQRNDLRTAAYGVDFDHALAALERIRFDNGVLADALTDLVVEYQFDILQELFEGVDR